MAVNAPLPFRPKPPDWSALNLKDVIHAYDRESDTLIIHLFGRGRPATVLQTGRAIDLLIDPVTHDIVGLQIEGFLAAAVRQQPQLLELIEIAKGAGQELGIAQAEIDAIRQRIPPERRLRGALEALLQAPSLASA
jgi:hypothetical protein